MPYADYTDLIARYDENTIRDSASDSNSPTTDLVSSPKVLEALAGASGAVNSATRVGGMYKVEDLEDLQGDDASYLKDIVCDLAMFRLLKRRPERYKDYLEAMGNWAYDQLDKIRDGGHVFPVPANIEAGKPSINGPSAQDYNRLNMLPDRTRRYYPLHGTRLPLGRQ